MKERASESFLPTFPRRTFLAVGLGATLLPHASAASAKEHDPSPPPFVLEETVWRTGETGTLRSSVRAGAIKCVVTDDTGRFVWSGEAKRDQFGLLSISVLVRKPGYYVLTAQGGGVVQHLPFAVVPAANKDRNGKRLKFGVCTHFGQRDAPLAAYDLLEKLGVDAVRDEIGWGALEKTKGKFTFLERFETYTRWLREANIYLLFVASYGNSLYNKGAFPVGDEAAAGYGRYCVEVLKRYGKQIIAVEIMNEPNALDPVTQYLPILKSAHDQIRAAKFSHEIISVGGAGIGGGMNPSFARQMMAAGGAAYCDSFSQHPFMYPHPPDSGYATTEGNANLDRALSRSAALVGGRDGSKAAWITEVGWSSRSPEIAMDSTTASLVSERKQAAFVARTLLGASRYPHLRGVFLYDFQDDGPNPRSREHRFGLVRQDWTPKPSYQAYTIAVAFLKDKTFVRRIHRDDSLLSANLYRDRGGSLWAAVWTQEITNAEVAAVGERRKTDKSAMLPDRYHERENPVRFALPPKTRVANAYDWQGRSLSTKVVERGEMSAGSLPLYLCLDQASNTIQIIEQR